MTIKKLLETLSSYRYRVNSEYMMHNAVAQVLKENHIHYEREYPLTSSSRVEFFLPEDGVVIECKIEGGFSPVLRQVQRYAMVEEVNEIILLTTRSTHRGIPSEISGVMVHVIWTGRAM